MKRIVSMLLASALIMTMGSACHSGGGGKDESVDPDAPVTIKVGIWAKESDAAGMQAWENYKATMKEKYPNITLQPEAYSYSADTFIPMAVSHNAPHVFLTRFTEPVNLIANGFVADVTSLAEKYGFKDGMEKSMLDVASQDGKIYGIPHDGYALALMLNLKLFRQAGLVDGNGLPLYPKTLDELAQTAKTLKEKTGKAGMVLPMINKQGGWQFSNIAWNFGAKLQVKNDAGKWVNGLNSNESVQALEYYKKLRWDLDVLPSNTLIDYETMYQMFGTGEAAMMLAGSDSFVKPVTSYSMDKNDIAVVPVPAGPGGQNSLLGGNLYMFSVDSSAAQLEACFKLLQVIGMTPTATDETLTAIEDEIKVRVANGYPIGPMSLNVWSSQERIDAEQAIYDKYINVNMDLYQPFYDKVYDTLRSEEPYNCQDMYAALDVAIQQCMTDKNADPKAQLDKAASDFQLFLDQIQ